MQQAAKQLSALAYRPHPHLYEINTWAWLEQLSSQYRRPVCLGDVPDSEWDHLQTLGFDFIWLMGIWQRSAVGRRIFRTNPANFAEYDKALPGWQLKQIVGSPYSIGEYRPDARIGTWDQLDRVRQKLRERGMGLILDFVPNHTGLDHPWTRDHPEYYILGTEADFRQNPSAFYLAEDSVGGPILIARGRDPNYSPWEDVAQLNYFNPATRRAVIGELRKIAEHCDGVRCDMAMLLLNDIFAGTWGRFTAGRERPEEEFWSEATGALPDFIWIAEVYWDLEWRVQQLGFQFAYDKRLYDRLRSAPSREVYLHLTAKLDYQSKLVRFLENHDEPRSAAVFRTERTQALGTLVATLPGMRLFHHGQLEGRKIRLPMPLCAAAEEPLDPAVRAFYEKILRMSEEEVFHRGQWELLEVKTAGDSSFENLIVYQWRSEQTWKLVVVNLAGAAAQGRLHFRNEISAASRYNFFDQLNDETYVRRGDELSRGGLYIRLEGYRAHLFAVSPG